VIVVHVRGFDTVNAQYAGMGKRLLLAVVRGVTDAAIEFWSTAKQHAPVFRGLLRESLLFNVSVSERGVIGKVGSGLVYASVLESGHGPAGSTQWFPNLDEIRVWARRKLGTDRWTGKGGKTGDLAYLVARAMSRTPRTARVQPYMAPAFANGKARLTLHISDRLAAFVRAEGGTA